MYSISFVGVFGLKWAGLCFEEEEDITIYGRKVLV